MTSSPLIPFDQSTGARARRRRNHDELLRQEIAAARRQQRIVLGLVAVCVLVTVAIVWAAVAR